MRRRLTARFALALGCAAVVALAVAAPAMAHVPTVERQGGSAPPLIGGKPYSNAQRIPEPVKSLAIYGFLARDERYDAYSFEVPEASTLQVELLVPVRRSLGSFEPEFHVVDASNYEVHTIPTTPRISFYEPFSLASFWRVRAGTVAVEPGRTYYFVVRQPDGPPTAGAYVIAVGGPEAFSGTDIAETVRVLPIIWSGGWGGGPARPGAMACMGGVMLVGIALVVAVIVRRRRATSPASPARP